MFFHVRKHVLLVLEQMRIMVKLLFRHMNEDVTNDLKLSG